MASDPGGDPMNEEAAARGALEHALDVLRSTREAVLAFEENFIPIKTTMERSTGRLVASAPVATFFAAEHVVFVPEEAEDALQLLVSPEEIEEGAETDRWTAYHGEPEHVRWAVMWIDSAKHGPWVFDGEAMTIPSALAPAEAGLVRGLNARRAELHALCRRLHGVDPEDPVCVGVDPHGIDVRARFGVLRAPFAQAADGPEHAERLIEKLLAG
jgi:hypothetical protein